MYCRLTLFLLNSSVINNSQHGFQSNKSTTTCLVDALSSITSSLDKKLLTLSLFINVYKTFNSIGHTILRNQLNYYGMHGIALQKFHCYLSNRFMYIKINSVRSECCLIKCGVSQGSIIGSLLFLIYVNDIFNVCNLSKCVLYADDTVLIISYDNVATLFSNASKYFAMLSIWFSGNKLA